MKKRQQKFQIMFSRRKNSFTFVANVLEFADANNPK